MATGPVVNQGKTAFLEEFLPENRDADLRAINRAWAAAGHGGRSARAWSARLAPG